MFANNHVKMKYLRMPGANIDYLIINEFSNDTRTYEKFSHTYYRSKSPCCDRYVLYRKHLFGVTTYFHIVTIFVNV